MSILHLPIAEAADRVAPGEVHVYSCPLDRDHTDAHLTPDEQTRARRFRMDRVRHQFVACRSQLRELLAGYVGLPPRNVPIQYLDGGKPILPEEFGIHFNVSHTDGYAVFSVSRRRIGIDIERDRPMRDAHELARRFFSPDEREQLLAMEEPELSAAFFRCWTRKEAILKAIGRGIQSLEYCSVSLEETDQPRLLRLEGETGLDERWQMFAWRPAPGLIAAGAAER